jgi:DNA-binding NarL/FixJ family response regulator
MIKVMLVDDHEVVRSGVRRFLEVGDEFQVISECDSGEDAYEAYAKVAPDIVIMDLSMPGMGGLEAIRRLMLRYDNPKVIVLSMHENQAIVESAFKAGAKGYITKSLVSHELPDAIKKVLAGETHLSADVSKAYAAIGLKNQNNPLGALSIKELEVFRLIAEGNELEDVAEILSMSPKTVANYQSEIKKKLGVSTPIEFVRLALQHGLVNL